MAASITKVISQFDELPPSALVDIQTAVALTGRSRNSIYRHFEAGDLAKIKVGNSTKIRVGELRVLLGGAR